MNVRIPANCVHTKLFLCRSLLVTINYAVSVSFHYCYIDFRHCTSMILVLIFILLSAGDAWNIWKKNLTDY